MAANLNVGCAIQNFVPVIFDLFNRSASSKAVTVAVRVTARDLDNTNSRTLSSNTPRKTKPPRGGTEAAEERGF